MELFDALSMLFGGVLRALGKQHVGARVNLVSHPPRVRVRSPVRLGCMRVDGAHCSRRAVGARRRAAGVLRGGGAAQHGAGLRGAPRGGGPVHRGRRGAVLAGELLRRRGQPYQVARGAPALAAAAAQRLSSPSEGHLAPVRAPQQPATCAAPGKLKDK
eukprot:scaffold724_cov333-Prasinococcus_capsulatus_cf.AAC.13